MLKLVIFMLVWIASCCAQEHLTCVKVDDVLTQRSTQSPQTTVQGYPGKRGPRGQEGARGNPGQKGESGVCDNHQMNLIRDRLNSLSQEMETFKNQSRENRLQEQLNILSQEIEALKNQSRKNYQTTTLNKTAVIPSPVYVHKLNINQQSWQESRQFCQSWGGDLAVHGVKTLEDREKLFQNLSIDYPYWIGASDIASEGNWIWVNGEPASGSELIWAREQPDGGVRKNCLAVAGQPIHPQFNRAYDESCSNTFVGLCEKKM